MQAARGTSLTSDTAPIRGRSKAVLVLGIALVAWLVDTGSKIVAERQLIGRDPVEVLGSALRLNLTRNAGAAFSTGTSMTPVISVFALVALAVALWFGLRVRDRIWAWAFGLLIAGIAGNLTDRLFREPGPLRGHVVDFLELPHWPIFNVADVCINVAAALIVLQSLRGIGLSGKKADAGAKHEEPAR